MKSFYLLLTLLLISGCSDHNTAKSTSPTFNISLSPSLSGSFPTLVPVNSQLVVYTTEPIDYTTVTEQTVYLKNLTNATLTVSTVKSLSTTAGKAILIRPVTHLSASNDYELVVTTNVATATGQHRSDDAIITFTTGTQLDTTVPTLISTFPEYTTTGDLEKFGIISFQFSEALSPLAIENVQISVQENGPTTSPDVEGTLLLSGSLLSFVPNNYLVPGSSYRVELNTTHITDLAANPYSASTLETLDFYVASAQYEKPINNFNGVLDYNLSVKINTLASHQNELYVGSNNGFDIFTYNDTATPTKLVHRSHLEDAQLGIVYSIELDIPNQRVYLGTSTGFTTVNISDLNTPSIISHIDALNANGYYVPVYGLTFSQNHLYLAASSLGIMDIDISNISAPLLLQTKSTQAPAFDLVLMNATHLAFSSYGNALSTINKSTLIETDIFPQAIYSHNLFMRPNANNYNDFYYASGIKGIGIFSDNDPSYDNRFLQSEAYVTRIIDHNDTSIAIMKDIGLGFFSSTGGIYQYQSLAFDPTAITYLDNQTSTGKDLLILSDKTGQLYLEVMN